MNIRIRPGKASGSVQAPPSKSMAHRLLLCAALSDEDSRVENMAFSEDVLATIDCIRALGKTVCTEENACILSGPGVCGYRGGAETLTLPVRESGSTLRFLIPAALTLGQPVRFTGAERLFARPLSIYEAIAEKEGFRFEKEAGALTVCGRLGPGDHVIAGNISSQFVTGLLYALPVLPGDSRIRLIPPVESRSYIDMTVNALAGAGIRIEWLSPEELLIPGGQEYAGGTSAVEGDMSNAAYLALLDVLGGDVKITGLPEKTRQGDRVYRAYYERLKTGFSELDLSDCPDLGPCMFAAAAALHGGRFTGTGRLRLKESDRCAAMQAELCKFGIRCTETENSFTVGPGTLKMPEEILCGHNDHRIVMALSGLLCAVGGEIAGAQAVRKSFPDYFGKLRMLGIEAEEYAVDQ